VSHAIPKALCRLLHAEGEKNPNPFQELAQSGSTLTACGRRRKLGAKTGAMIFRMFVF
jgi:hypothetical protein